jgi:anaerobic magnesium-protoporphyrin IX monomethyl ester cyclase
MVDVLFTHSYFLRYDPKEFRAMMPYPPLGTLYAAGVARQHGYSVALSDSMLAESEEEFRGALELHHPKAVVIFDDDFNYLTKMCLSRMRQAAFTLSALARAAGCSVIVHGSD